MTIGRYIAIGLVVVLFPAGALLWQNNKTVDSPSPEELRQSLDRAVAWMQRNRQVLLQTDHAPLWWMVSKSAQLTHDPVLQELFEENQARFYGHALGNPWSHLFSLHSTVPVDYWAIDHLPDYMIFFFYALTCDRALGAEPIVLSQQQPDFCDDHRFSPACVTHQLLGARFLQTRRCGDQEKVSQLVAALQDRVVRQLTWDVRVVDVYLQRVMMLVESGARERVKPVWLRRVLNAQAVDGGWTNFDPLVQISPTLSVGFSNQGIGCGAGAN